MALYNFHRLLIAVSILFDIGFTFWCVRAFNRADQAQRDAWTFLENPIVWGVASSLLVVLFILYLIHFNRSLTHLKSVLNTPMRCPACAYDLRGSQSQPPATCPECGEPIGDAGQPVASMQ